MPSHTFLARARDSGLGKFLIPSHVLDPYVVFPPWGEVVREARPVSFNWPSTPQFGQPSKFAPAGRALRAQWKKKKNLGTRGEEPCLSVCQSVSL